MALRPDGDPADDVGGLHPVLTALLVGRVGTRAEIADLARVLPHRLRSDRDAVVHEVRQLEAALYGLVGTPRDGGRRIEESVVIEQPMPVARAR
jgi:hypothetical protein